MDNEQILGQLGTQESIVKKLKQVNNRGCDSLCLTLPDTLVDILREPCVLQQTLCISCMNGGLN